MIYHLWLINFGLNLTFESMNFQSSQFDDYRWPVMLFWFVMFIYWYLAVLIQTRSFPLTALGSTYNPVAIFHAIMPKKNAGAAKSSKGKSSEDSGGKTEKKGGNAVKVRMYFDTYTILRIYPVYDVRVTRMSHFYRCRLTLISL